MERGMSRIFLPNPFKPFHLYIFAIDITIGTMLEQKNDMNKE